MVQAGKQSILQGCIERLPRVFREVLILRELEEMSYRQISEIAGLQIPETAKSRHRATLLGMFVLPEALIQDVFLRLAVTTSIRRDASPA